MMAFAAGLRSELARLARNRIDLALLTVMPAVLLLSMAAMIFPGSLSGLKVVVVDRDGGPVARAILRTLDASPKLRLVGVTPQSADALAAVRREEAQAVLIIPHDVGSLQSPQPVEILYQAQFLASGSLASTYLQLAAAEAVAEAATEQGRLIGPGTPGQATGIHIRLLGNPTLSLEWYLGLLLGPGVLHLAIAVTTIASLGQLMEGKSFAAFARSTPARVAWLIGRMTPHVVAGTLWSTLWILWLILARGYRLEGSLAILLAGMVLLFVATVSISLFLIVVTREVATALSGAVILAGSALAYSGASLPVNGASWFVQLWNAVLPLTHYLRLQMDEAMGASLRPILIEGGTLLLYPLLPGGLGLWLIARAGKQA